MVERYNRTVKHILSIFTHKNSQDLDEFLPFLMMASRATKHKYTGSSQNLMMFEKENSFPIDRIVWLLSDQRKCNM